MAKAKKTAKTKAAKPAPAAKKPKHLAANRRRRRARANPSGGPAANPPITTDLVEVLLPGFGAYAATRVLSRVVYSLVQKRWPKLGKHAAAIAGAAAFGGVWFFAHKVKALAKYHDGVVMGSGVAALHGIASCYLPAKYSWLLADCRPEDVAAAKSSARMASIEPLDIDGGPIDEYSHLEAQLDEMEDSGSKRPRTVSAPRPSARPVADALRRAADNDSSVELDPDLSEALDGESVDDLYTGAFEN
jgi:hypothetical protein